jgi:hypothetical protein
MSGRSVFVFGLFALSLGGLSLDAFANAGGGSETSKPSTEYRCADLQTAVRTAPRGQLTIKTGDTFLGMPIAVTVVNDERLCGYFDTVVDAHVRTRDVEWCYVGYQCIEENDHH